jgi:hypothetical protein
LLHIEFPCSVAEAAQTGAACATIANAIAEFESKLTER